MSAFRKSHKYGKGECDRCGFVYKLKQLQYEWTGLRVCPPCWDPLPAQDFPRPVTSENIALDDPRPRNDVVASNGLTLGLYQIIGRAWYGTDTNITGGEVARS